MVSENGRIEDSSQNQMCSDNKNWKKEVANDTNLSKDSRICITLHPLQVKQNMKEIDL